MFYQPLLLYRLIFLCSSAVGGVQSHKTLYANLTSRDNNRISLCVLELWPLTELWDLEQKTQVIHWSLNSFIYLIELKQTIFTFLVCWFLREVNAPTVFDFHVRIHTALKLVSEMGQLTFPFNIRSRYLKNMKKNSISILSAANIVPIRYDMHKLSLSKLF